MQIKYNEKIVEIKDKENWTYNGVSQDNIKELNLAEFNKIQSAVTHYVDNKKKIDEENRQKEKQAKYEERMKKHNQWKTKIETEFGEILKDQNVKFSEPKLDSYNYDHRKLEIGHTDIYYDGSVYREGSWHSSKTDRPWIVYSKGKRVRYGKLAKAIEKAIEKNTEVTMERKRELEKESKEVYAENKMKKFAGENGFEFQKDWHSSSYRRHNPGYYTYSMKKENIKANIVFNEEKNKVIITSYTITKEGITIEDLK